MQQDQISQPIQMQLLTLREQAHTIYDINSVAVLQRNVSPGARLFATAGDDGGVKIWRISDM